MLTFNPQDPFSCFVTQSLSMKSAVENAQRFAMFDVPLLIQGETGTGKDLLAKACHFASLRREKKFIAVNCAGLPDEDAEYNMYEATAQILREYGFEQYEMSNYAKKGRECRHNVGYWIRQDYLGFGLGASSLYGKERFVNTQDMKKYLENSRTPKKIREKEPPLTREDEMAEFMFLGLRMTRGISKAEFERQFGSEIDAIYGDVLRKYKSMGLLLEENGRIFLSREGIHVSNSVMADFLP